MVKQKESDDSSKGWLTMAKFLGQPVSTDSFPQPFKEVIADVP